MTLEALRGRGYDIDAPAFARLERFVSLLLDANQRVNLTAIRTPEAVWDLHISDALALLPALRALAPREVMDLGTGGGLPGIPLACVLTNTQFTLLDATRKKVDAVRAMASALELKNVETVWARAETLADDLSYRGRFDLLVARAVAPLADLIRYAAPLIHPGGECWFPKSLQVAEEQEEAERVTARAGVRAGDPLEYALAEPHGRRQVIRYRKLGGASPKTTKR